jgi:pantoate--beta-alanine ligase
MHVVESRSQLQLRADAERAAGQRIALVPTMGALHAGHLSLVSEARKRADRVWVSIFVNPTQFNEASDFAGYPRTLERDLSLCRTAGVDLVYVPRVEDVYPDGAQTWVEVEKLAQSLCGASRPGHFRGVATVVSKLFLAAKPHVAFFGQKDFQQVAVIRRMVRDLGFDVEIAAAPIVREPDGLALSSRNVRLGPQARRQAVALVRALDAAEAAFTTGERRAERLLAQVRAEIARAPQAELDYVELCDPESLEAAPSLLPGAVLLALAVHFRPDADGCGAPVRLIDNRLLQSSHRGPDGASGERR